MANKALRQDFFMLIDEYAPVKQIGWGFNFTEGPISIIRHFGIDYYVAMDGLSAPLVLITSILSLLVIIGSRDLISEYMPL